MSSDADRTVTRLPDGDDRPLSQAELALGGSIGPYTLIEKLGEGGFGVVYLAEQREPVRRRVALKVLKLGMDTREIVSRFEQERQTLAVMDHPGIAKVFGAGATQQRRPYFVMEYVAGTPITHFCDKGSLSIADRIQLYVDVCRAIQHAHHKGVIHRDLKPGNILVSIVDGKPSPKIIDFGIAKAASGSLTERSLVTQHGQFIGTPEYMSPEQASESGMDIDTRSDIYSLGVVLYELLTGFRPFDASSHGATPVGDLRRLIRENEPPRASTKVSSMRGAGEPAPSAAPRPAPTRDALDTIARRRATDPDGLRRQLKGDLDWILLKAMEKDRSRRYDSASAFADDLLRHLSNEPVVAGPPSATYKITKFVRRNRGPVAAGTAFVLLLAASAVVSTSLYREADAERTRASAAAETAKQAQAEAEAESLKTKEAQKAVEAEAAKTRQALVFLTGMFESINPDEAQGREITVREVLDKASKTADQTLVASPEVNGYVHEIIGRTLHQLGKYSQAETMEQRAYDLRRESIGPKNRETLESLHNLSATQLAQAKFDLSQANLEKAVELRREAFGAEDPDTLASLDLLAQLRQRQGDLPGAEKLVREVIDVRTRVLGAAHQETVGSRCTLADLIEYQGRLDEADTYIAETVELARKGLGDEHSLTLTAMSIRASILSHKARYAEAESTLRQIIPIKKKLFGDEHDSTLVSENALAMVLRDQNKDDEAEALYRSLVERATKVYGPEHPTTLTYVNNLAQLLRDMKEYDEAQALFKHLIETQSRVSGPESRDTLIAMNNYGLLLRDTERYEEALTQLAGCRDGLAKMLQPDHWMMGLSRVYVGDVLGRLKRFEEAEPELVEGYGVVAKALGETHPRARQAAGITAKTYEAWGKPEKAAEWKTRAEAVSEQK